MAPSAKLKVLQTVPSRPGVVALREWWECPWCGGSMPVAVDEDGCCATCGGDAVLMVAIPDATRQQMETRIQELLKRNTELVEAKRGALQRVERLTQLVRLWAEIPVEFGAQGYAFQRQAVRLLAEPWP